MAGDEQGDGYDSVERDVAARLFTQHYDDLASLARSRRRRANAADTMMTEDILHESFLRLGQDRIWHDDNHFLRAASLAIRHVTVDYARRKLTAKRRSTVLRWICLGYCFSALHLLSARYG